MRRICLCLALSLSTLVAYPIGLRAEETDTTFAGRLEKLEKESAKSKKVKFSGYIQARYESHQDSENSTADSNGINKDNLDNIYIRRARLKAEYQGGKGTRGVVYIDGGKDKLRLLEAWVEIKKTFGTTEASLSAGQQNVPFGYEIEYSSSRRDFPERSTAEQKLFPGERDRLVNLTVKPGKVISLNAAVLNGPGISNSTFSWESPFKDRKDFLARVKVSGTAGKAKLHAGASGYFGRQFNPKDTIDFRTEKDRIGADAQAFLQIFPELGESGIRAEVFVAKEFDRDILGWYIWLSQKLGKQFGAALRFDTYDPDTDLEDGKKLDQVSIAGHYYHDENVRITCAYDIRKTEEVGSAKDPDDNLFTVQVQFAL